MTLFWFLIMVAFCLFVVGVGYVIREAVDTMDDEVEHLSPFRRERPFDFEVDAPEFGRPGDAA